MSDHTTHHDDCGCLTARHQAEVSRLARALAEVTKERDEARKFMLDSEKAYCGSAILTEVLDFFEKAGCGKPGTPNTIWAMTQEIIARAVAAEADRDALAAECAAMGARNLATSYDRDAQLAAMRAERDAALAEVSRLRARADAAWKAGVEAAAGVVPATTVMGASIQAAIRALPPPSATPTNEEP